MASPDLIKFLVKVLDENHNEVSWEHLCYTPRDLYLRFVQCHHIERYEMADFVSKWAKEDFNIDIAMTTAKDIGILRELVLDKYKNAYPHLIRQTDTDRQGWIRVWVSNHMERDLQRYGQN